MSSSENENNNSDEEGRKVLQRLEEKASKKVQRWSKKMTKDFIVDLQSHDCLWDVSQSSFSDRDEREKAVRHLANKYKSTTDEIKKKILSLKSQLSRELRNVNKSRSGDGADDIRISEWEHWDSLQFLVPAITPGKSVDSIQVIESTSAKDSSHHTPEKISKRYDNKRKLKSTPLSEKRLKALNSCVNILEKSVVSENKNDEISYFCKNLDEKLKKMDYRAKNIIREKNK